MAKLWTLDELSERVALALAHGYPGQSSARVREVPDRRTIRWYTQIGLVDRPTTMRGRTAMYGPRHLAQLVAIKRLQADGLALGDIQRRLTGATGTMLERIARLPAPAADAASTTEAPGTASAPDVASARPPHAPPADIRPLTRQPVRTRTRFWVSAAKDAEPVAATDRAVSVSPARRSAQRGPDRTDRSLVTYGVRLDADLTLLLGAAGRPPDGDDIDAIERAAGPLIDVLRRRGLARPADGRDPS